MPPSPWLLSRPQTGAHIRLFCFPYAGGSATGFMPWQTVLGPRIEVCAVQLPGRGARFNEPPIGDFESLTRQLVEVIATADDLPYAFFGHSLGGLVAFELCHRCLERGLPSPRQLFISATNAPASLPSRPSIAGMDDRALIETLRHYNGTPAELLANRELMELLLPAIRADFALLENYRYRPRPKLPLPLYVLAGRRDEHLRQESLPVWQQETAGPFRQHWFEGDHFYLHREQDSVLELLRNELVPALS